MVPKFTGIIVMYCAFLIGGCKVPIPNSLMIAAASNMQFALEDLVPAFEAKHGISCHVILGSSGKLAAQISEGAPYHIFISADKKYTEFLDERGKSASIPFVFAQGQLVIWSLNLPITNTTSIFDAPEVQRIAIANPQTAPYGVAATNFLSNINKIEKIKSKLVYGESVSQVNQFILSGAADVGLTAKSVVLSEHMKKVGSWMDLDSALYKPIGLYAMSINGSKEQSANVQLFSSFLKSEEAKEIMRRYGYLCSM